MRLSKDIPDRGGWDARDMPWVQSDEMKERTKFVLEWEARWKSNEGRVNIGERREVATAAYDAHEGHGAHPERARRRSQAIPYVGGAQAAALLDAKASQHRVAER